MELAAGRSEAIAAAAQEQMEEPEERREPGIFSKLLPWLTGKLKMEKKGAQAPTKPTANLDWAW